MSIRTHEEVKQQLQDLMSTVKGLMPELSFLVLEFTQDEEDPDAGSGNNMFISHGKTVTCNTVWEITYRPAKTKDRFLHECGHALFRLSGKKQNLEPIVWPDAGCQDWEQAAYESNYMIHELGAEVFAHQAFGTALNYGEARGTDVVHHFYNAAINALQILCDMEDSVARSSIIEQAQGWARLAFKYYLIAPYRPDHVGLEDQLHVFIQGGDMVFPDDLYLHLWEES